jgi:hypothetical protein
MSALFAPSSLSLSFSLFLSLFLSLSLSLSLSLPPKPPRRSPRQDSTALLDTIIEHVEPPKGDSGAEVPPVRLSACPPAAPL